MKKILFSLLALLSTSLTAQTEVTEYQPGITEDGITYFLPSTALRFTITATCTTYTPGEYCRYAQRYLRLKEVPQTAFKVWKITGVKATPFGIADKKQAYSIKLKNKTLAPLVSLSADGRLLSVNGNVEVAEDVLPSAHVIADTTKFLNPADYKTEEILAAGSIAKMAELTANEIYDIRENRSLLTKGQADFMPKDGQQLKLMLYQLDTQENALLQLFRGTKKTDTHIFTLDYVPHSETKDEILFRFSKHLGLVKNDNVAGEPYTIEVKDLKALPNVETISKPKDKKVEDLRYAVPGKGKIILRHNGQEVYKSTLPMAQFGRVEHLGGDLFNKKSTTRVYLSPSTGAITKIEGE